MQVVKNNKDYKYEEEMEEPSLGKIADVKDLNFAKNTESNIDEVDETIRQICVKNVHVMRIFWTVTIY